MVQILFAVLTISSSALADNPLCEDLADFSCSPGTFHDGTGSVLGKTDMGKKIDALADKYKKLAEKKIDAALNAPDSAYFRDLAMGSLGLGNSPICQSQKPADVQTCQTQLREGLGELLEREILSSFSRASTSSYVHRGRHRDLEMLLKESHFADIRAELGNEYRKDSIGNPVAKKVETKIFPEVKQLLIERLNSLNIDPELRRRMVNKIQGVRFANKGCSGTYGSTDGATLIGEMSANAFYNPLMNTFSICSGYLLGADSEFVLAQTIGHELSHAIDPCGISHGPKGVAHEYKKPSVDEDEKPKSRRGANRILEDITAPGDVGTRSAPHSYDDQYPIKNLLQCLRSKKSFGAKDRTQEEHRSRGPRELLPDSESDASPGSPYNSSKPFCQDQIQEAFSDWMAAEVLPKYIEKNYKLTPEQMRIGYANVWRMNCTLTSGDRDSSHPSTEKRINNGTLVQPQIREQMGCTEKPSKAEYCDPGKSTTEKTDEEKGGRG